MIWRLVLFSILFNSFALLANSQNQQLYGNWVKTATSTIDGSAVIDRSNIALLEMDLKISPTLTCIRYYPLTREQCFAYTYDSYENKIQFNDRAWRIVELNQNNLVLLISGNGNRPDILVSFERESVFYKDYEIEKEGEFIIATSRFSPFFNANLKTYLAKRLKFNKTNGRAIADLKIDFNRKEIKVDWKETTDFIDKHKIEQVFNGSFRIWQNVSDEFNHYIIPFTVQRENEDAELKFIFYSDKFQSTFDTYNVSKEDFVKSKQLFKKAHQAFQKENYIEALNEFKACYAINHTELRAMYNVAHIYNKLGQNRNACLVWQHLVERGQKKAKALSEKNCKSN
jgi:hypothetical protein